MKSLAIVLFNVLSVFAFANPMMDHGPCAEDAKKFCADVKMGHGAIMKCLKTHESELSEACKAKSAAMKHEMKEMHAACKGDVDTLCGEFTSLPQGPDRWHKIHTCLKSHMDKVSDSCKKEWKDLKEARKS